MRLIVKFLKQILIISAAREVKTEYSVLPERLDIDSRAGYNSSKVPSDRSTLSLATAKLHASILFWKLRTARKPVPDLLLRQIFSFQTRTSLAYAA